VVCRPACFDLKCHPSSPSYKSQYCQKLGNRQLQAKEANNQKNGSQSTVKNYLSFDLWSSPNYLAIAAIVAHFVNADWTVSTVLLAFRDLEGPHSGENIATVITAVCQEYLITDRLGCFVLDNATNNDTCIAQLAREFKWDKKEVTERRLRCFGHIINLVAQEFVFGGKADIFQQSLAAANQDIESDVPKLWELRGPIGKLHYIVVWILRTPQRRKQFARGDETYEAATLVPKRENATR
jgi:hypothetical protein